MVATKPPGLAEQLRNDQVTEARAKRSRDPAACGVGVIWGQAPSPLTGGGTLPVNRYSEVGAGPPVPVHPPGGSRGRKICSWSLSIIIYFDVKLLLYSKVAQYDWDIMQFLAIFQAYIRKFYANMRKSIVKLAENNFYLKIAICTKA